MFVLGMCTYFGKYEGREIIPIASGIRCLSINLRRIDTSSENLNQSSNWINRISMKVSKVPQESSLWEACRFFTEFQQIPTATNWKQIDFGGIHSKNFPTYPWNIPQTQNQPFMKKFLSFWDLGRPGVCSRGMLGFS